MKRSFNTLSSLPLVKLSFAQFNYLTAQIPGYQINAFGQLKDYIVPVNTLESITGIDYFPALKSSVEIKTESSDSSAQWDL